MRYRKVKHPAWGHIANESRSQVQVLANWFQNQAVRNLWNRALVAPEQVVVQRCSGNINYPSPLVFTPTMTFNFYHFVFKLVTKVPISCVLEVLTSRHSFCWRDLRVHILQAPRGVHGVLGPGIHRVWVNMCIFPFTTFLPQIPSKYLASATFSNSENNNWSWCLSSSTLHFLCLVTCGGEGAEGFAGLWSLNWRCRSVTGTGLGWVSPCWGIFWLDLPCLDKQKSEWTTL